MTLTSMSFDGYSWEFNCQNLTFSHSGNVNIPRYPYGGSVIQDFGRQNCIITGSGYFVGETCADMYNRLRDKFDQSGVGILTLPGFPPIKAFFNKLVIKGEPKPDLLGYEFEFIEVDDKYQDVSSVNSGTGSAKIIRKIVPDGETLWDISYKYGINIDKLVELNPQVRRPDIPIESEAVQLR